MRFVAASCKPEKQERRTKSTNIGAESTTFSRYSATLLFFSPFFFWNWALATACTLNILSTSSLKSAFRQFFNMLKCKPRSGYSPVRIFCGQRCQIEAPNERPQEPHYPKKHRVSRPRLFFSNELTCFQTVALPNYLMRGDMMMWLTWWCECYTSDVFYLDFLWIFKW